MRPMPPTPRALALLCALALGVAGHAVPSRAAEPRPGGDAASAEAGTEEVLVFVTSWCPVCREATGWLKAEGIRHVALDVESDPRAMALYRRAGGDGAVPLILVGGERIRGFEPRAVKRALDRHRAAAPVTPTAEPAADEAPADPGVTRTVGADGKVHYTFDGEDLGGEVHEPHVEFVTTRPEVDETAAPDPAMDPVPGAVQGRGGGGVALSPAPSPGAGSPRRSGPARRT